MDQIFGTNTFPQSMSALFSMACPLSSKNSEKFIIFRNNISIFLHFVLKIIMQEQLVVDAESDV